MKRLQLRRLVGLLLIALLSAGSAYAQQHTATDTSHNEISLLIKQGEDDLSKGDYRRALVNLKRSLKLKKNLKDKQAISQLYTNMAVAFMNMKMYPQALKYYYKANLAQNDNKLKQRRSYRKLGKREDLQQYLAYRKNTNIFEDYTASADSLPLVWIADNTDEDDTTHYAYELAAGESMPIRNADITACFNDSKRATGYAVLVHVQQPIPGRKRAWTRINIVGHTFITLVKYNNDDSYVCRTFGLYPKQEGFLTGTPLHPLDEPQFKNDSLHDWTQVVGKFINRHKFEKILEVVQDYDQLQYNLNNNNCTDFSLQIADIAGISIQNTSGKWPLGKGNNPGAAGQSIIEGQVRDTDGDGVGELFIYSRVKGK